MKKYTISIFLLLICSSVVAQKLDNNRVISEQINQNPDFKFIKNKALEVVKTGFNAGDGYMQVWIRDFNTFIELAMDARDKSEIEEALTIFFQLQDSNGSILDGFTPKSQKKLLTRKKDCVSTALAPEYCGHKNTVETDQETSLIQAVYKYVKRTEDTGFLKKEVGGISVSKRMEMAMNYLLENKWSDQYGLITGATTADWGDVQHAGFSGVDISGKTKFSIDIYDNAMLLIALSNMMELLPETELKWREIHQSVAVNTMKYLWDDSHQKFIPHLYLDGSPFPEDFNEDEIFYHGGTAVAIEAGLLNIVQIAASLEKMMANVKASGAATIGLTLYPVYPRRFFRNPQMKPWGYQNGGDWTWFGGRMIQQLIRYGFIEEAYEQLLPMTERAVKNDGFYEWYTKENQPRGSGTFRGEAGVLYKAILMLEDWAEQTYPVQQDDK